MALCCNTYRRGGVYWWRARITGKGGAPRTVAFSLKVHDPRRARQLGVRLTAEADRLRRRLEVGAMGMDEVGRALIEVREAGRAEPLMFAVDEGVLAHLDAEERRRRTPPWAGLDLDHDPAPERIARLAAAMAEEDRGTLPGVSARARSQVVFDDNGYLLGIDNQPDPTPVMAFVYRAIAHRGARARLTAEDEAVLTREGRTRADIEAIRHLLVDVAPSEMLKSWRLGPTYDDISARLLAARIAPSLEVVHAVRRHVLLTRAATLAALSDQPRFATSPVTVSVQSRLANGPVTDGNFLVTPEVQPEPPCVNVPVAPVRPATADQAAAPPDKSISLPALVEDLLAKRGTRVGDHTRRQYRSAAKLFVKVAGIDDVRTMGQEHLGAFFDVLARLPKSHGKSPADKTRSLDEIIARGEAAAAKSDRPRAELIGLDPPTVDRYITQLGAILKYVRGRGHTIGDLSTLEDMREHDPQRDEDKRLAFAHEDEVALFSSPPWAGSVSEESRLATGALVIHDSLFWVPLFAKYQFASRSEATGIMLDDVDVDAAIPSFWLRENDLRATLKTRCRRRQSPLHPELIRLGVLDYIRLLQSLGFRTLFPDLLLRGQATPPGDLFDKVWAPALDAVLPQARDQRKTLHSFRKGGNTTLAAIPSVVAPEVRLQLMGHTPESVNGRHYTAPFPLEVKLAALKELQVSTAHLRPAPIRLHSSVQSVAGQTGAAGLLV